MAHDLRFALRMILSHRLFSAAVVATVALGIGLNTMVFTLVNAVLFKAVPVPGGAQLVSIRSSNLTQRDNNTMRVSYPDFRDYRAQNSSLAALEAATDEDGTLSETGIPPQAYRMEQASSGFFEMLHIRPVLGRGFLPGDDKPGAAPVVVIGYGIWQERYAGSPGVLGRQVRINEKPATIVGVMPKGFKFPSNVDMWESLVPAPDMEKRTNRPLALFGMLKPGVGILQANVEMSGIARRLAAQYPDDKDVGVTVETFQERYNGGGIRLVFLMMMGAVGFVLLIACANVANMMLSRAMLRQREMSIRSALGASRWRVVRQLLIESVMLSIFGGVLGLALAWLGVHWFDLSTQDVGKPYWIEFTMNYTVFGYFAALCIFSGLLFGIAPAMRFSRVDVNEVLKDGARSVGRHRGGKLSSVLVVFQFALTLVLLSGAGVFVHSLFVALAANQSVPADQITTARIDFPDEHYKDADARQRFYDQLLPRLQGASRRDPCGPDVEPSRPWGGLPRNRDRALGGQRPGPSTFGFLCCSVSGLFRRDQSAHPAGPRLQRTRRHGEPQGCRAYTPMRRALLARPIGDRQAIPFVRRQEQAGRLDHGGWRFGEYRSGAAGEVAQSADVHSPAAGRLERHGPADTVEQ